MILWAHHGTCVWPPPSPCHDLSPCLPAPFFILPFPTGWWSHDAYCNEFLFFKCHGFCTSITVPCMVLSIYFTQHWSCIWLLVLYVTFILHLTTVPILYNGICRCSYIYNYLVAFSHIIEVYRWGSKPWYYATVMQGVLSDVLLSMPVTRKLIIVTRPTRSLTCPLAAKQCWLVVRQDRVPGVAMVTDLWLFRERGRRISLAYTCWSG